MVKEGMKNVLDDLTVVKRSGQRVEFNETKIVVAIKKAFDQVRPVNSEKEINGILHITTAPAPQYRVIDIIDYDTNNPTFWSTLKR